MAISVTFNRTESLTLVTCCQPELHTDDLHWCVLQPQAGVWEARPGEDGDPAPVHNGESSLHCTLGQNWAATVQEEKRSLLSHLYFMICSTNVQRNNVISFRKLIYEPTKKFSKEMRLNFPNHLSFIHRYLSRLKRNCKIESNIRIRENQKFPLCLVITMWFLFSFPSTTRCPMA